MGGPQRLLTWFKAAFYTLLIVQVVGLDIKIAGGNGNLSVASIDCGGLALKSVLYDTKRITNPLL